MNQLVTFFIIGLITLTILIAIGLAALVLFTKIKFISKEKKN